MAGQPTEGVSIIMPAYAARRTIAEAVGSVLAQNEPSAALEIVIAADDGVDYRDVLERSGIGDPRLVFVTTPEPGSGASAARNAALDAATMRFAATLDADDLFAPDKIARALPALREVGLVSTGLYIVDEKLRELRLLGVGPDQLLSPATYKFTNLSMDSMILWDRSRADPRYDEALPCMTDLDFLMRLFGKLPACFHVGAPLHYYRKVTQSISNGSGVAERMIAAKSRLRDQLDRGYYSIDDVTGLTRFLTVSLQAEKTFAPQGEGPHLFEDHLGPMLLTR